MASAVDTGKALPLPVRGPRERSQAAGFGLLLPPLTWMLVLYLAPLLVLLVHAFWSVDYLTIDKSVTFENFRTIVTNGLYPRVLLRTAMIAAAVTITDIVIAFPIAYFLAKKVTRHRELLLILVIFPLWSSYLVRAFAWRTILGRNGVLNSFLQWTGIIDHPLSFLLYSKEAMYLTFCQVWLPFMILPIYSVLGLIPNNLMEAASDLGSSGLRTFLKIILPLSWPGVLAGTLSVFSLTMGDYITPTLLGGPGDQMIGRIVADNFGAANNWPLGAALVIPVLLIIFALIYVANRFGALGGQAR